MEQEPIRKRSLALPIMLVVLMFSLIGNVFFYAQLLQGKQEEKYQTGQEIATAAKSADSYYDKLIKNINSITEAYELGIINSQTPIKNYEISAYGDIEGVLNFINEYHIMKGTDFDKGKLFGYLNNIEYELKQIFEQSEPYTDSQKVYIANVKAELVKQQEIIKQFNFDAADNRSASIQLASGFGWLEIAEQLDQELSEKLE